MLLHLLTEKHPKEFVWIFEINIIKKEKKLVYIQSINCLIFFYLIVLLPEGATVGVWCNISSEDSGDQVACLISEDSGDQVACLISEDSGDQVAFLIILFMSQALWIVSICVSLPPAISSPDIAILLIFSAVKMELWIE